MNTNNQNAHHPFLPRSKKQPDHLNVNTNSSNHQELKRVNFNQTFPTSVIDLFTTEPVMKAMHA